MNFHLSYPWLKTTLLKIQGLLKPVKKKAAANGLFKQGIAVSKPEHFAACQVGMLFSGNSTMLFLSSFGDSVLSLCVHVGSWNLNLSSPWVATLGLLCQNKAAGCAGEEFLV